MSALRVSDSTPVVYRGELYCWCGCAPKHYTETSRLRRYYSLKHQIQLHTLRIHTYVGIRYVPFHASNFLGGRRSPLQRRLTLQRGAGVQELPDRNEAKMSAATLVNNNLIR